MQKRLPDMVALMKLIEAEPDPMEREWLLRRARTAVRRVHASALKTLSRPQGPYGVKADVVHPEAL